MKKILMMAFVSAAMLAMVSCSKDKEEEAVSLVGTHWVGTETFNNIPMIGSIAATLPSLSCPIWVLTCRRVSLTTPSTERRWLW